MKRILAVAAFAAPVLAGCAGGPPRITAAPLQLADPVAAPVAYVQQLRRTGPRFNQLGGEIPRGVPEVPVEEFEMEDIPPGTHNSGTQG